MTSTKFGIPVEEYNRLMERAERFYEDELESQLIDEFEGYIVQIDGRTLEYAIGLYGESDVHRELVDKCDEKPVVFSARVGSIAVYQLGGATIVDDDAK